MSRDSHAMMPPRNLGDLKDIHTRFEAAELAARTVRLVMEEAENSGRHTAGSWQKEGHQHHINHADEHLMNVQYILAPDVPSDDLDLETELTHALTRCVMALWSLQNGVLGDNGPEGKGHVPQA